MITFMPSISFRVMTISVKRMGGPSILIRRVAKGVRHCLSPSVGGLEAEHDLFGTGRYVKSPEYMIGGGNLCLAAVDARFPERRICTQRAEMEKEYGKPVRLHPDFTNNTLKCYSPEFADEKKVWGLSYLFPYKDFPEYDGKSIIEMEDSD